ncbi:uncharacterized protein PFL1_06447 [Pseudozyma flocculosa PF-1]|nr:uncharacterized protein PFL1_06447 [Pseudozyma flocculosa PF-1]EPQ25992.1 hypothetical protein PFL1_06447 [Pseudozyma flocculosa PF-1]
MERRRYCAPYVGCAFRVVFTSHEELDAFLLHAKRVFIRAGNLSEPRWGVKRSLFRASHLDAIQSLCARLSIPLAFQVERLFLNALLFPPDVHDLEYFVSRSIRDRGEAATAVLVMNLAVSIQRTRAMHGTREAETHLDLRELWAREAKRLSHAKSTAEDPLSVGLGATFEVYNATVTPTRVILAGPVVDTSNRVLRAYPEHAHHFLRVSFADEDFDRFPVGRRDLREVDAESFVHERIGGILKDGITVAGRKWDMLAWSGSSLRTHQCWFSTPFVDDQGRRWTADLIRQGLGAFSEVERFPARFGARLSQAFSATAPTIRLRDEWVEVVDDIRSPTGNLFTDGVGQISPKLMQAVWLEYCRVKMMINERRREVLAAKVPSAIQVRIGGAKGVLCVNPLLTGMKVKLRPSMIKFSAPKHTEVEVATSSLHPLPTRLNRPLINALEDLGVGFANFLVLQRLAVEEVNQARLSFKAASELCKRYGFGTAFGSLAVFEKLQTLLGLAPQQLDATGILNRLIGTSISAALGDLKRKARIPTLGPTLIGVADEFGFLRKDQIFAQVEEKDGRTRVIEGMILIGRSPTIHPGDTRMVRAVAPPKDHPLMQLRNVVVFSCEAHGRSLPSMLGGGDLDGDIYSLYEEPLLFINRNFAPGTYKQPKNKQLNRTCKPADLADFFTDFVINDQIGVVSHLHLHISDRSDEHSLDPDCVKLASLHAQAVDFCKTGQAVHRRDMPYLPFRSNRPDYLAQNDHAPDVYKSKRALGRLYRDIAWTDTDMPLGPAQIWLSGDGDGDGDQAAPSATSDIVAILDAVGARFPYARPTSQQAERAIQERCTPLLRSFTYHLSRIAAWVPESRHTAEWLREEEIILGSPVMATTSKLKRWQEKLQSATSELVPILRHQLGVIVTGGDPLAIRRAGRTDLDAQLQHRNFGTGRGETYDETCRAALERAEAAPQHETVVERTGLVVDVDVEVDGERGRTALDRLGVEGELVPSFAGISLSEAKKGSGGGGGALTHENIDHDDDDDELEEIRGLFAACLLGAHDVISRSFGGSTFALVALGSLLNLIEAREKRLATRPVPLR